MLRHQLTGSGSKILWQFTTFHYYQVDSKCASYYLLPKWPLKCCTLLCLVSVFWLPTDRREMCRLWTSHHGNGTLWCSSLSSCSFWRHVYSCFNHFSTTGRCSGPPRYDTWRRQAARPRAAIVTSSFKIILTQTYPLCGSTCLQGRCLLSIQWCQFCLSLSGSLLKIMQLFASFSQYSKLLQWRTVLLHWRFAALCFRPFIW